MPPEKTVQVDIEDDPGKFIGDTLQELARLGRMSVEAQGELRKHVEGIDQRVAYLEHAVATIANVLEQLLGRPIQPPGPPRPSVN